MKKYILQDEQRWLSTILYDTSEEAREQAENLLKKTAFENSSYFTIKEINTNTNRCDDYKTVYRKKEEQL